MSPELLAGITAGIAAVVAVVAGIAAWRHTHPDLQTLIDRTPDGGTLDLKGRTFTHTDPVRIVDRARLTILGHGARLVAKHSENQTRPHLLILRSARVHVSGLNIEGTNTEGGVDAEWLPDLAFQHAVSIVESAEVGLVDVSACHVFGDLLYLRRSSNVWAHRFDGFMCGRQGVAAVSGGPYLFTAFRFDQVRRSMIDLEPHPDQPVDGVAFVGGNFGRARGNWISAAGQADVHNVVVRDSTCDGPLTVEVIPKTRNRSWSITDVRSTHLGFGNPHGALMRFRRVDGLTVRRVHQDFAPHRDMVLVQATNCTDVTLDRLSTPGGRATT